MHCSYFAAERCRSCTLIEQPYADQLVGKQRQVEAVLGRRPELDWLAPVASLEAGFRNKAKMVVGGTAQQPTLGILDAEGRGIDLQRCGLYPPGLTAAFPVLAEFIVQAALAPYDVPRRSGELKFLIVTESPDGELMLRFVLRSQESVTRIRKHLPDLMRALPNLQVVSVNLHPEHKATVEGQREIVLTEQETLRMRVNDFDMYLRPQSFFQTNTPVAAALYRQAREWVAERAPESVWDLYCGVGGFALHCAAPGRDVIGIETSAEAIASAELSARQAGLDRVAFQVGDATAFALGADVVPELVIVNPPRRGLGEDLCRWLESSSAVRQVVYSSCHAGSLARDLALMPSLRPRRARLLDMFPQTTHYEVLTLLERG
ncbi:23S rRNA (uracil(747)-C(5))-methyltransferase RlmC [Pengzhenrongella frigida]|uniref:23S rRNA (Uracil(747)-C(5))-methyltransferase RlmC n=1 Tax=Pengzhenrongella frigida TaxID=1259133 RepID=A0A4Q5N2E2_9MICO|nr:23S rRNA (uracil(747)-C(5))-methyltransferase RlmC [Cellulomonas sp. HLT2-17]RYV52309.1 23S rRNA (uracil(747)-C(5))-methyltransferase RlmC [Cellulomonas sp. HLT2-17]